MLSIKSHVSRSNYAVRSAGSGEDLGMDLGFHSLTHLVHLCVTNSDPVMRRNLSVKIITPNPTVECPSKSPKVVVA